MPAAAGSITVTPTQTTTNTLRAANAKGATATATFTVTMNPPTVSMTANPTIIAVGNSSTLSVTANDATQVVITDNTDSNPYWLPRNGGTQTVTPTAPTTYTATAATAGNQTATATSIVTVTPGSIKSINHVVFMMQENRTFDTYYGMPNPIGRRTASTLALHCDLKLDAPGANLDDAPAIEGFAAQLGFRLPNMVISPYSRRHYVSHVPMDHTAIIRFIEDRFIGDGKYLTNRDAVQPNLLDLFDFQKIPRPRRQHHQRNG